jgi:glucosamine--fructose-6-phosphate aminotransferase (isomerizing)
LTLSFSEGVAAQPDNLRSARKRFLAAELAPLPAGTVVFSGIGASWHALAGAVRALQAAGRRAFAVAPNDLRPGLADGYVMVSQSGRSAEALAAVERVAGAPVLAVCSSGDSPVARAATGWLPLGEGEDTPLSTLGYTATVQALGMLCEAMLDGRPGEEWARVPDLVADVLAGGAPALGELLSGARTLDIVGGGPHRGSAGAAALLVREGLRIPAAAEETRQYLHGPLEAVGAGSACIVFGGERERELAAAMASYGAATAVIGDELPAASDLAAPILDIVPVQLAVARAGAAKGFDLAGLQRPQDDTKLAA